MTIKLLIFDFDGVIVNTSQTHFDALNKALAKIDKKYCVSEYEDLHFLGTRPTKEKLKIISKIKQLPFETHEEILENKRKFTLDIILQKNVDEYFYDSTIHTLNKLRQEGYLLYVASNTNREFINTVLNKIKFKFDYILCNNDVQYTKPHPEIYLKAFLQAKVAPDEALIFEDSITGQEAAIRSGAHLFGVEHPSDLCYNSIINRIKSITRKVYKWKSEKINVVIPMAGEGSRFADAGWTTPKPLIPVHNLPMVATVVRDLNIDANIIFIIKTEHDEQYNLETWLHLISPDCQIVKVSGKQTGAATTILSAQHLINNDNHLMIVNSDQMWDWEPNTFYYSLIRSSVDGSIVVFSDPHESTKWSFVKLNEDGFVSEVAEKNPISKLATAGIYYFTKGSDFVKYALQMVNNKMTVNNEYYVAPVYNLMVKDNKKISTFSIKNFWPTGTPEELVYYLENRKPALIGQQ